VTVTDDRLRASWASFSQSYEQLLDVALDRDGLDDGARAALLRRLIGNIQYAGLQLEADPAHPVLINPQYSSWNWGHSNPDTLYLSARVDDAHDYRVHGTLGSVSQTTFGVYTGFEDQSSAVKVLADDLEVAEDGSFELFFTRAPRAGSRYPLPAGARSFGCYQTYGDWEEQSKGTIRIECLGDVEPVEPDSPSQAVDRFDAHLRDARDLLSMWIQDIPDRIFSSLPANEATTPMQPPAAMAGTWFSVIPWALDDGEGLVIAYRIPPECSYTGICLTNQWSEMIDPRSRQTSLNPAQSQVGADGVVRVLVAADDPGVGNWLDARGYRSGIVTWRTSVIEQPPPPTVTKIRLADIEDHFGPSSRISRAGRTRAIAARERHFANRDTP